MRLFFVLIVIVGFFACEHTQTSKEQGSQIQTENLEKTKDSKYLGDLKSISLENIYYECDTVIRLPDTLKIINSAYDTTLIETGIFSYLQYDYPMTTPSKVIELSKAADQLDKKGQTAKAIELYRKIIKFYKVERPKQLEYYSDMNGYLQYEVNTGVLCSYAYEKLGDIDNAIKVLQPNLANVEAGHSKIHERYIRLCIDKYGIDKVRTEINNCGKTVQLKKQVSPENDDWVVNVFGADIGIGNVWETNNISASMANHLIRQMDFYKLLE